MHAEDVGLRSFYKARDVVYKNVLETGHRRVPLWKGRSLNSHCT